MQTQPMKKGSSLPRPLGQRTMGGCHRAGAVFGVWFIMLGAADRPGADVVAADSGQNRPSHGDGVFADFPDGERPPPLALAPLAQRLRALPPWIILMQLSGAFFLPRPLFGLGQTPRPADSRLIAS